MDPEVRCFPYALANALHYMGFTGAARKMAISDAVHLCDLEHLLAHPDGSRVPCRSPFIGDDKFDPLNPSHRLSNPVVAEIFAFVKHGDGKAAKVSLNHCICFWKDWLIDPNHGKVQLISIGSLNRVADKVITGATYGGIFHAKELVVTERDNRRKKKKKNYSQKVRRRHEYQKEKKRKLMEDSQDQHMEPPTKQEKKCKEEEDRKDKSFTKFMEKIILYK